VGHGAAAAIFLAVLTPQVALDLALSEAKKNPSFSETMSH